jgi:diguanylate cyclase (GGDEF)-like protein
MDPEARYDDRARMGRISGGLWIIGALVGLVGTFLPGASHQGLIPVIALSVLVLGYGIGSVTGLIPWEDASLRTLAIGMVVTVPVVGIAIYLTGASLSYVEPLLVCSLLYAALFFPPRWAWPLAVELVVVAGAPLVYDPNAIDNAFLSRYLTLAVAFLAVTAVMVKLKRDLVDAESRQRAIANRDPLTGISNRRAFDDALRGELRARTAPGGKRVADDAPLALLIIDLDDFKSINDDHGHQDGDAVLRRTAERAQSVLRADDVLARIGGDEFAVIAPGARGDGARGLAEALRAAISASDPRSSLPACRATVGVAIFPEDGEDFGSLLHAADQRLLRAKLGNASLSGNRSRGGGTLRLL